MLITLQYKIQKLMQKSYAYGQFFARGDSKLFAQKNSRKLPKLLRNSKKEARANDTTT